jgi:acetylornithine deacetylase
MTCTTDARIYSSIHHNQEEVVVTCYGPDATNIHGIDESASLESMRVVTAAIAFIRDWCGLEKCSDKRSTFLK